MNRTALYDWHVAHGGRMVDFAGWEMPIQYTSIIEEHNAVRQRVGLFDIAHMGRLAFAGPQAGQLLDHLLTNDVSALDPGQVRYSLVCNEQGGILDDVLVYRFDDAYLLVVNASNREKIVEWIGRHSGPFDAQVRDDTQETFMAALQGPQAAAVLAPHTPLELDPLRYYTAARTQIFGLDATLSRTGYTGEDGFEIIVAGSEGLRLWEQLMQAGADAGIAPCGLGCRDTLRLEAAMPLYGHEMDETTDPFTAGLGFGVKLQAGDFIGKEALEQLKQQPATHKRVGLVLEGRRIAREGATVLADDTPVGRVTSGTFSPTLGQSIAMARVERLAAGEEADFTVDIRGQQVAARIVPLPFYKRAAK
jgi:aminomethyltransferase